MPNEMKESKDASHVADERFKKRPYEGAELAGAGRRPIGREHNVTTENPRREFDNFDETGDRGKDDEISARGHGRQSEINREGADQKSAGLFNPTLHRAENRETD